MECILELLCGDRFTIQLPIQLVHILKVILTRSRIPCQVVPYRQIIQERLIHADILTVPLYIVIGNNGFSLLQAVDLLLYTFRIDFCAFRIRMHGIGTSDRDPVDILFSRAKIDPVDISPLR